MEGIECCANCKHCVAYPKNNRYGDVDYMCLIGGYYIAGIIARSSKKEGMYNLS